MTNGLTEKINIYKDKINAMERDLKEGLICFSISLMIISFISFWGKYINEYWLLSIALDFLLYSFLYIGQFTYQLNKNWSLGVNSIFTTESLLLRLARIFTYSLLIQILFFNHVITFFNIMTISFLFIFLGIFFLTYQPSNNRLSKYYLRYEGKINIFLIFFSLVILGIMMKLYNIYSTGGWDEGWYSDITYRMFQTQNWFEPLYYDDFSGKLKLFDKPPLMFILGAIGISLFDYSSLAIKWPMGVLSGLMAISGYMIFAHRKRNDQSIYIEPLKRDEIQETDYAENFGQPEELEKNTDGKVVGIIFGLSMAVTWFLAFYGRTAYLDAAIVGITAFTALFAIKAIDHWFYGNTKRAYIYIGLTAIINMLDLLAKAWQGLIVGPSIAIYLFVKYYEYFIPKQGLSTFLSSTKEKYFSVNLKTIPNYIASLSFIFTLISFSNFTSKVFTYKENELIINYLPLDLLIFKIDVWGLFVSVIVFLCVRSIFNVFIKYQNLNLFISEKELDNYKSTNIVTLVKKQFLLLVMVISSTISGFIGSFIGAFGFDFFYTRFYAAITEIFTTYFTIDEVTETRLFYGELALGFLSLLFSWLIVLFCLYIFLILFSAIIDLFLRLFIKQELFKDNLTLKIASEWALIMPLAFYGILIGYWAYILLFKGEFFERSTNMLMFVGVAFAILALLLASIYVDILKYVYKDILRKDIDNNYFSKWIKGINNTLIFLAVTTILIILSFYPFLAWVEYMDLFVVNNPYVIRVPGELSGSGINEGTLTYAWLFFEYYINWRYTGAGSQYTVVDSLGGLISPLFLASLPFFITGVYAYLKKRDYATLIFYASWLFIVFLTFLSAAFQLNYYYLAVFFPYFGISSYGIFWTVRKTKSSLNFKDRNEKTLLSFPVMLLIFFSLIFVPFINNLSFLDNAGNFNYFLISLIFVVGGFIFCTLAFVRSIPESFALAFIIFYLYNNLLGKGIGNIDSEFMIISIVLISFCLFTIRDRIPLSSSFFILLIILSAASSTGWWVKYKAEADDKYEQMGQFILSHGGNYNGSTWVFPEVGARYSMRYYLQGYTLANDNGNGQLMSLNNSNYLSSYLTSHPELKFFIVINQSFWEGVIPTSSYTASYLWLKSNFIWVNPLLDKPSSHHVHLFVNSSVLLSSELESLDNHI